VITLLYREGETEYLNMKDREYQSKKAQSKTSNKLESLKAKYG
jgi:hypothetical protein